MLRLLFLAAAIFSVAESTLLVRPAPICQPACNIYQKQLVWTLEDCICRPIQNPCLAEEENQTRIRCGKTRKSSLSSNFNTFNHFVLLLALVPVTESLCLHFLPKKCRKGLPVIAKFPQPPLCKCKNKPGYIVERKFANLDELRKWSA
ncbi:hypothetical protein KR093_001885, partial [Drosophila rubida]